MSAGVARGARALALALAVALAGALAAAGPATAHGDRVLRRGGPRASTATPIGSADVAISSSPIGSFTTPFAEPAIDGINTNETCAPIAGAPSGPLDNEPRFSCKPAAASVNVLPDGAIMYFDAFEGTENIKLSFATEFGFNAVDDQSRRLELAATPGGVTATWRQPAPVTGGANAGGDPTREALLPAALTVNKSYNAGALFCSDNVMLADGRVLVNGGTDYYLEPGIQIGHTAVGVLEEEGIRQSRIYDPAANSWAQTGSMHHGRWYPSSIELPSGDILTVGGVTKVIVPIYPTHLGDSFTTVRQSETYGTRTGRWTLNPKSADRALPLYPRLHLLPDGTVYYDPGGQPLAVFAQSVDELSWDRSAVYDPAAKRWTELGEPGLTDLKKGSPLGIARALVGALRDGDIAGGGRALTIPGYRGSTFSIELPLVPDAQGRYTRASFLTAGGTISPIGASSYLATNDSRITTIDVGGARPVSTTRPTGDLRQARWFGSAVLLPTGEVVAFNGADRDEVVTPGLGIPLRRAELFDPATETWKPLASAHQPRTYHNVAVLLPDARVLVSGHAPLPTLYTKDVTIPGGITSPNDGRDPTFEIFSPPYLSRGAQPVIRRAPRMLDHDTTFTVKTDVPASEIASVVLVSNPAVTHLVDANQRNVELPVLSRGAHSLTVKAPPSAKVAPPGAYMLFVNKRTSGGLVPSVSVQTFLGVRALEER